MAKKKDGKGKERKKKKNTSSSSSSSSEGGLRRGVWSEEEDKILVDYITINGHGTWSHLPKLAGLLRCGKSCRLRWTNYLRPGIKRGPFTPQEESAIISLHQKLGNKWAAIASELPGRTDNDIKNFWNSHLRKRSEIIEQQSSSSSSKSNEMMTTTMMNNDSSAKNNEIKIEPKLDNQQCNPTPMLSENNPPKNDYFMRLWNSDVGESFRNFSSEGVFDHSPQSQTSESTKGSSSSSNSFSRLGNLRGEGSGIITATLTPCETGKTTTWNCKKDPNLDTFKSEEDSSEAMMKMLLDFPEWGDDMGFVQGPISGGESTKYGG